MFVRPRVQEIWTCGTEFDGTRSPHLAYCIQKYAKGRRLRRTQGYVYNKMGMKYLRVVLQEEWTHVVRILLEAGSPVDTLDCQRRLGMGLDQFDQQNERLANPAGRRC